MKPNNQSSIKKQTSSSSAKQQKQSDTKSKKIAADADSALLGKRQKPDDEKTGDHLSSHKNTPSKKSKYTNLVLRTREIATGFEIMFEYCYYMLTLRRYSIKNISRR